MPTGNRSPSFRLTLQTAVAAVLVVTAFLLHQTLEKRFRVVLPPFLLFYPVVMFAALLSGLWVGLFATVLSTMLAGVWIFPPAWNFKVQKTSDLIALTLFFAIGIFTSVVADRYRRSLRRLTALESEHALLESRARLEASLASMTEAIFICNSEGQFVDFNDAFATFHKFQDKAQCPATMAEFHTLFEFFSSGGELVPDHLWPMKRALLGETASNVEFTLRRKDTGQSWIASYNFGPIKDKNGTTAGAVVVARDITEQRQAQDKLLASESRYRTAFQTSLDCIAINRLEDGMYIDVNESFVEISGYARPEIIGRTSLELCLWTDKHDRENLVEMLCKTSSCRDFQAFFRRKNGEVFWGLMSASMIEVDGVRCILSVSRDLSDLKLAEQEIRNLAFFDPLTGLANRRLLMERLGQSIAASTLNHRKRALLFVDLDNFKTLNDTLGHQIGDLLLREAAHRLGVCVREVDTLGRVGADEFFLLLEDLSETPEDAATQARVIAEQVLAAIDRPYHVAGSESISTCSIGISVFGDGCEKLDEILQQADIALDQAKAAGKNALRFFAPALQATVNARAAMEDDLRRGIKAQQFVLFYQPQIEREKLIGAEALLRWQHPRLGLLLPGDFIPLAEDTRLIIPLGNWVLEAACSQIATWAHRGRSPDFRLAVNISALQLSEPDFVVTVLTAIESTGANPRNLQLELTESMLVDNVEDVIAKMKALKSRGVSFSVDDFGTGYSSLAYLRRLPVDQLKIDRSFVRDLLVDATSGFIAQTIISLSKAMDLPVLAEGVETEEQREFLAHLGCHAFQGYLFSPPLPVEEFNRLMPDYTGRASVLSPQV